MNYELMTKRTSDKIVEYVAKNGQASANELVDFLQFSERAVFRQLSNLLAEGLLAKIGKPPRVFYSLAEIKKEIASVQIDKKIKKIIDDNFLIITPSGKRREGFDGFEYWCVRTKQPVERMAVDYVKILKKYEAFKEDGLIDGMHKFKTTFEKVSLDHVFYLDFYSIERFGKTKIGQLLLYAKQSQDKKLMKELAEDIRKSVDGLIKKYKIDGIGFIPPTVKREVQFMKELEKNLHPHVRRISLVKIKTDVIVPQKTLNKLEDRIENARNTIVVAENSQYDNILLIDDAVGSGATLNETATQIRRKKICKGKIIGLAITGSFKGFDIISEV